MTNEPSHPIFTTDRRIPLGFGPGQEIGQTITLAMCLSL